MSKESAIRISDTETDSSSDGSSAAKKERRQQTFRKAWLKDPQFRLWLQETDHPLQAKCTVCVKYFTASRTVLKSHANSMTHSTNMQRNARALISVPSDAGTTSIDTGVAGPSSAAITSSDAENDSSSNNTFAVPAKKKGRRQAFREAWLKDRQFQLWLERVEDNPYRGRCRVCSKCITANITDLKNHGNSNAHMMNMRHREGPLTSTDSPRVGDIRPVELISKAKHFSKARNLEKVNSVYKLRNVIPFENDHTYNGRSAQSTNPNHSVEQTTENSTPESSLTVAVSQQQPVITYTNTKRQSLTQLNSKVHQSKGIAETVNPPLEENEFEVFGRSIGLQLKAMPIQTAVKAQQYIQTYLSTIRLQHMASNQNRCCQKSTTPPPCSDNGSGVQARTRGSCGVLPPPVASSGIRSTLKRPP